MKPKIHAIAGFTALITIAGFWLASLITEMLGSFESIKLVKQCIVWGMIILIPSIMATAISGNFLGKTRSGKLVAVKQKRMPLIALNGIFILVPSAFFLNHLALNEGFGKLFYSIQALELAAGGVNFYLLSRNFKDGLRLSGRHSLF